MSQRKTTTRYLGYLCPARKISGRAQRPFRPKDDMSLLWMYWVAKVACDISLHSVHETLNTEQGFSYLDDCSCRIPFVWKYTLQIVHCKCEERVHVTDATCDQHRGIIEGLLPTIPEVSIASYRRHLSIYLPSVASNIQAGKYFTSENTERRTCHLILLVGLSEASRYPRASVQYSRYLV